MKYLVTAGPMYEVVRNGEAAPESSVADAPAFVQIVCTEEDSIAEALPMLLGLARKIGSRSDKGLIVGLDVTIEEAHP